MWIVRVRGKGIGAPRYIASLREAAALQRESFGIQDNRCCSFGIAHEVGRRLHHLCGFFVR